MATSEERVEALQGLFENFDLGHTGATFIPALKIRIYNSVTTCDTAAILINAVFFRS